MPTDKIQDGYCDTVIKQSIKKMRDTGVPFADIVRALSRATNAMQKKEWRRLEKLVKASHA